MYIRTYIPAYAQCMYVQSLFISLTYLQQTTALEYAVVDKSKKKVSQEQSKLITEYDDTLAEKKMTQVSIQ